MHYSTVQLTKKNKLSVIARMFVSPFKYLSFAKRSTTIETRILIASDHSLTSVCLQSFQSLTLILKIAKKNEGIQK